jgi:hypothetical protein
METDLETRRKLLVSAIHTAFASENRDEVISLHQAYSMLNDESVAEQIAAREKDKDLNWHDLSQEDIVKCYELMALSIFCNHPKSLRYYLPALMSIGLSKCNDPDEMFCSLLNDVTGLFFENNSPNSFRQSEPTRIVSKYDFSKAQILVIIEYLQFCRDFGYIPAVSPQAFTEGIKKWELIV